MRRHQIFSSVGIAALLIGGWGPSLAAEPSDTTVEEVVVTAQKRAENLQDVPIAITALTAETLQNQRVGNLLGLSGFVCLDVCLPTLSLVVCLFLFPFLSTV